MRVLPSAAVLVLASVGIAALATAPSPPLFHPHFQKRLECHLADGVDVTLGYQTVTFRADAAAQMKPGQVWHLAGARFATTAALTIGGQEIAPGEYSMKTRKTEDGWELVLDTDGPFSRDITPDAKALRTELITGGERFEHLNIDVQPSGDKRNTTLHLDVRFDTLHARALIELPAPEKDGKQGNGR